MIEIMFQQVSNSKFADYGKVVDLPNIDPTSQAVNYAFWSDIASYEIDGETEIGICKVFRQPQDNIAGMERHLLTPEILIPIDAHFVVPLLKEGHADQQVVAFEVGIGQSVVINSAIWHGACIPVGQKESSYFVIFRRGTLGEDVEMKDTAQIKIAGISRDILK